MAYINESISSEVFHFTTIDKALSILTSPKPQIILSKGGEADARANKECLGVDNSKGQIYYWSLTRNFSSKIGYVNSQNKMGDRGGLWGSSNALLVRFEVDGNVLNANYKGGPVCAINAMYANSKDRAMGTLRGRTTSKLDNSYGINPEWVNNRGRVPANGIPQKHDKNAAINRQLISQNSETEDRVISRNPIIPNPERFIKRIDIFVPSFCWYEVVNEIGGDAKDNQIYTTNNVADAKEHAKSNGPIYIVVNKAGKQIILKKTASLYKNQSDGSETGGAFLRNPKMMKTSDCKNFSEESMMTIISKVQKMLQSPLWKDRIFIYQDINAYNTYASRGLSGEGAEQALNGIARRVEVYRNNKALSHDVLKSVDASPANTASVSNRGANHFRLGDIRSLAKLLFWVCYTMPSPRVAMAENIEGEYRRKGSLNKATIAKREQEAALKAQQKNVRKTSVANSMATDKIDTNRADAEATKRKIAKTLSSLGIKNTPVIIDDMAGQRGRGAKPVNRYSEGLIDAILKEVDKMKMGQSHMTQYFKDARKIYRDLEKTFGGTKSAIREAILSIVEMFGGFLVRIITDNRNKCFKYHGWTDRRGRKPSKSVSINEDDIRDMVSECVIRILNEGK